MSVISAVVVQATDAAGVLITTPFTADVRLTFAIPATALPAGALASDFVLATRTSTGWAVLPAASVTLRIDAQGTLVISTALRHFSVYSVLYRDSLPAVAPPPNIGAFAYPPVFAPTGEALVIFFGGSATQLEAAGRVAGGGAAWVQDALGAFHLLIFNGPPFLRDAFVAAFPAGFNGPTPVTLIR